MDLNKAIPIQSEEGDHFGFVLMASNEDSEGNCVFMVTPKESKSYDDSSFQFLSRFGVKESGEHNWKRIDSLVHIDLLSGEKAELDLEADTLTFVDGPKYKTKNKKS